MLYVAIDYETGETKWFTNIKEFRIFREDEENFNTHIFFEVEAYPVD